MNKQYLQVKNDMSQEQYFSEKNINLNKTLGNEYNGSFKELNLKTFENQNSTNCLTNKVSKNLKDVNKMLSYDTKHLKTDNKKENDLSKTNFNDFAKKDDKNNSSTNKLRKIIKNYEYSNEKTPISFSKKNEHLKSPLFDKVNDKIPNTYVKVIRPSEIKKNEPNQGINRQNLQGSPLNFISKTENSNDQNVKIYNNTQSTQELFKQMEKKTSQQIENIKNTKINEKLDELKNNITVECLTEEAWKAKYSQSNENTPI